MELIIKSEALINKSQFYKHIGSWRTTERVLRFLLLLQRIVENMYNNEQQSFGVCWRAAYDRELARYHNFFLRKTVKGILYLVPSRETFLKAITNDFVDWTREEIPRKMEILIENSNILTKYFKNFMKQRGLLELP